MKTIQKTVLVDGYLADGMSVVIKESNSGWFGVYLYIHCEDRHSEVGMYDNYDKAFETYQEIIETH